MWQLHRSTPPYTLKATYINFATNWGTRASGFLQITGSSTMIFGVLEALLCSLYNVF